eukprot:2607433-Pyramimonas_sp.AAC.1
MYVLFPEALWVPSRIIIEASWGPFDPACGRLGSSSRDRAVSEPSWTVRGASWGLPGQSWGLF